MDPLAAVIVFQLLVAHGGVPGAIAESSVLLVVLLVAGLTWRTRRAEGGEEEGRNEEEPLPLPPPEDERD